MKLTPELIRKIATKAIPEYIHDLTSEIAERQFREYEITDPLRMSHFLAQICHESALLTAKRENLNYSAKRIVEVFGVGRHSAGVTANEAVALARKPIELAERVYGLGNPTKAKEFGHTMIGQGYRYRGVGPLCTTGKRNISRVAEVIGKTDIIDNPDLLLQRDIILDPALIYWRDHKLNRLADQNDIGAITQIINGGYNGIADRKALFSKIYKILSNQKGEVWEVAATNPNTSAYQRQLVQLGYSVEIDGRHGPETDKAVRNFQRMAGIPDDGIVGPITAAALEAAIRSNTTPRQTPRKVDDQAAVASGAAITGTGAAAEVVLGAARQITQLGLDSPVLKLLPVALICIGVVLTLWPTIRRLKNNA